MIERVRLDDFNEVPSAVEPLAAQLHFLPLDAFLEQDDEAAEPLLGTREETVLPVGGDLLSYGQAGSGKTTLAVDGIAHLAAGIDWLGLHVPQPVVVAIIENEGPRSQFRDKLRSKRDAWSCAPFAHRWHVLAEPWAAFSFGDESHRHRLAEHLRATDTDLLLCGPVATLGMIGGGTPDEINAFVALLRETRALLSRPLALWLVHHENRAGQVSGAWERVPDTLVHVTSRGNGHTRLYWQKVRWSSELHQTTMHLSWADGASFNVDAPDEPATAQRIWDDIAEHVLRNGGCSWNQVDSAATVSGNATLKRQTRDRMSLPPRRAEL